MSNTREYNHNYYIEHRSIIVKNVKKYHKNNPDKFHTYQKIWNKNNPEKIYAHKEVRRAILSGKMQRKNCEICGKKAEAHHPDYKKIYQVRWLCKKHHLELHRKTK